MEQSRGSRLHMSDFKPPSNIFCNETTFGNAQRNSNEMLCHQEKSSHVSTNTENARNKCSRRSRTNLQFSVNLFSDSEAGRYVSTDFQFETAQSFCQNKTVSADQSFSCSEFPTGKRLVNENRPEPSLFSCEYCKRTPQVPETVIQQRTTANDMSSLWAFIGTQNLCHFDQLGGRTITPPQYQVRSVSRRFFDCQSIVSSITRANGVYDELPTTPRLVPKLREICAGSDSMLRVPRHHLGHRNQHEVPVGTEVPHATHGTSATDCTRQLVPQTGPVPNGETQLRLVRDPERAITLSHAAIPQSTVAQRSPLPSSPTTRPSAERLEMVGERCVRMPSNSYSPDLSSSDNRCFGNRMGRSTRRDQDVRGMDPSSANMACQYEGNVCCARGDCSRGSSFTECSDLTVNRQPHCCLIYKQRRRNQIQEIIGPDKAYSRNDGPSEYTTRSSILPREIQWRSRCAIQDETLSRMALDFTSHHTNIPDVGHARCGLICFDNSSRHSQVRDNGYDGRASCRTQRTTASVGVQAGLGVPTAESDPASSFPTQYSERQVHFDRSEMGQSVLAGRLEASSTSKTVPDSTPSASSVGYGNGCSSPRNSENSSRGVADFGWADVIENWSNDEKTLLLSSWRKSTMNTYQSAWKKWKGWCDTNAINHKRPGPAEVARYLAYLHNNQGLAYKTILVHKSVIATFTNVSTSIDISSNFFVRHMLKAISVSKEKSVVPPIWDPQKVINYLEQNSPDENNLYQVSQRTAILFLLSSGRRVHDLTLLTFEGEQYRDEGDFIVFWPRFGSKTDSSSYRQSGWKMIKNPNKSLDCVYWTRRLIAITEERRKEVNNLHELFITIRGVPKPASRTIIGGWIKAVLRNAGIEASPGSVRSAVASLNWLEQFPVDKILETGNWRQEHTFRKYYRKIINRSNQENSSISLSAFFNPIR